MLASRKLTAAHRASGWLVFLERVLLHALNTKCRRAVIFTEIFIADNCATEASARVSIGSATPPALSALWHAWSGGRKSENRESLLVEEFFAKQF